VGRIFFLAQKSRHSWVSFIPPMREPEILTRLKKKEISTSSLVWFSRANIQTTYDMSASWLMAWGTWLIPSCTIVPSLAEERELSVCCVAKLCIEKSDLRCKIQII
jgi:hypothetical protein